jgi:PKD repeat protein
MKALRTVLPLLLLLLACLPARGAEKFVPGSPAVPVHPKVDSVYSLALKRQLRSPDDPEGFEEFAEGCGISSEGFRVEVEIHVADPLDITLLSRPLLASLGFLERVASRNFLEGTLPVQNVFALADAHPCITWVRRVRKLRSWVTSEGVSLVRADTWHGVGITGSGVDVAIIDGGFQGITTASTSGEFATTYASQDYTGGGFPGMMNHGTACAEIVYDIAPGASYHLLLAQSNAGMQNAANYCIANGIDVVSMSMGACNDNFLDGVGTLCTMVNNAYAADILWVNAAGNEGGNQYWIGSWTDANADNYIEFSGSDSTQDIPCSTWDQLQVILTWDCSTTSNQDYDLELWNGGSCVTGSYNLQSGSQQPYESIAYPVMASGTYEIRIRRTNAAGTSQFRLFCTKQLEYGSPASSLGNPNDATGCLAVGAIDQGNWSTGTIEFYSARGPTLDGRTKPDLCAPTGVSTWSLGATGFAGTSASAPHVAGIGALYRCQYPSATAAGAWSDLESWAVDLGPAGKDNTYGAGKARLDTSAPAADFQAAATTVAAGVPLAFSDLSTGMASSWAWDFGDGGQSSARNPSHTYTASGTFSVSLTVTGPGGSDTETKTSYISVTPTADFGISSPSGPGPLTVIFSDLTLGTATSWVWDFGDGGSSIEQSPSHTFTSLGSFTVSLSISGPHGSDAETKTDCITVTGPACGMYASTTSGPGPLTVLFSDTTVGAVDTWLWDFGGGNTSAEQNPTHTFTSLGGFSVTLTVWGPYGTDSLTQTNFIRVTGPNADFTADVVTGSPPLTVNFSAAVTGQVSNYLWNFGDGATSTEENPLHVYAAAGDYDVRLDVDGPYGPDTMLRYNFVRVAAPPPSAGSSGCAATPNRGRASTASVLGFLCPWLLLAGTVLWIRRMRVKDGARVSSWTPRRSLPRPLP